MLVVNAWCPPVDFDTCIFFSLVAIDKRDIRPLVDNMNKYGDRRSPWRRPQVEVMKLVGSPLIRMEKDTNVTHIIIL